MCRRCARPLEQPSAEFRVRLPASNIENISPFLIRERVQILPRDIDLTAGFILSQPLLNEIIGSCRCRP
jgi:hypothetical protein